MNKDILDSDFNNDLHITNEIKRFLNEIATWARVISIAGFIMLIILIVIGFIMGSMLGSLASGFEETPNNANVMASGAMGFIYLLIGFIYFFPLLWLYSFAKKMKIALKTNNQDQLRSSFRHLKNHYLYIGILIIIAGVFYTIALIGTIIGFAAM